MATDAEKAQLEAWERYSVLFCQFGTDKALDIERRV
ncbi:tail fiber assembly protein [Serratia marcescens]|nr:tail fiber assembly protein [Serratia marcescens]MBH3063805.1 tail fiber assembly protein [Serratia marcescens]NCJ12112.1 tail fiber assembly protein [Serratia marcescens]NDJ04668.1 tail fiber assembly protein [Serratia marcescens]